MPSWIYFAGMIFGLSLAGLCAVIGVAASRDNAGVQVSPSAAQHDGTNFRDMPAGPHIETGTNNVLIGQPSGVAAGTTVTAYGYRAGPHIETGMDNTWRKPN